MIGRRWGVVGGGVAGLACARHLAGAGIEVEVFDKAREVGGRTASRRSEPCSFDHGAQYFTARDPGFSALVRDWVGKGVVSAWEGRFVALGPNGPQEEVDPVPRYVGVPTMGRLADEMARGLTVRAACRITQLSRTANQWWLISDRGTAGGPFDGVAIAVAVDQAAPLLAVSPELRTRVDGESMSPCWAVMAVARPAIAAPFDGAFVDDPVLRWAARDSSKPGRDPRQDAWVLHATPHWSRDHLEDAPARVAEALWRAFGERAFARDESPPTYLEAHRWRFAAPDAPGASPKALFDPQRRIGVCGDWCGGPRIEGAYLSGVALAQQILAHAPAA